VPEKRISFLLNRLVREMNSRADSLLRTKYSLTYSQFVFLVGVSEEGPVDVTRLAARLSVTKGAISKRLDWFIERGLATKVHAEGDSKRVLVELTAKGKELCSSSGNFLEKEFLATLSKSPDVDYQAMVSELNKFFDLLEVNAV